MNRLLCFYFIFLPKEVIRMTKYEEGQIVSSQIGSFGDTSVKYGYITLKISDESNMRFKVDASTEYETLELGESVAIRGEALEGTNIIIAKKIRKKG